MKEALRHLEYALKFGVEQNLLTPYILARLRMQRPAGFYNLYEHELIESDAKLEFVRAKLAEYRCIEATRAVHRLARKDMNMDMSTHP